MPNEENVTTKFKVDISDLKRNVTAANASIRQYKAELENADAGMKESGNNADSLSKKIEAQSKIVDTEKKKLDALKEELQRYEAAMEKGEGVVADLTQKHKEAAEQFGESSEEAKKLAKQLDEAVKAQERNEKVVQNLRTQIVQQDTAVKNAEGRVRDYNEQLDNLGKEEEEVGEKAKETTEGGISAFAVALGNLAADAITAVIDKLGELASAAIDAFENLDEGRDNLIKATGAIGEQAEALTAAYSKTAKNVVGDLGDIGSAVGEVNTRFGWTGDQLSKTTEDFVKFADITGMDATEAVRGISRAMQNAGIDAEDYGKLLDEVAIAAQASGISASALTENLTTYGAQLRAVGFDTEDTIALLAQWEKAGVNTSTAITGLRKASAAWAKDGKDSREEFTATVEAIKNAPTDIDAAQKAIEAFGNKSGAELADAIRSGRFEYEEFVGIIAGSAGTVSATYEETQSGIDKINLAIQGLSVTFGEIAGKLIDEYAQKIERIISLFTDLLNGTSGAASRLADSVSGLLLDALNEIGEALPTFFDVAGKIAEQLINGLLSAAPKIIDSAGEIIEKLLDGLLKNTPKLITGLTSIVTKLISKLGELLPKIVTSIVAIIPDLVKALTAALPQLIDAVLTFGREIIAALPDIITMIAEELPVIVQDIADVITEQLPILLEGSIELFNALVQAIPLVLPPLVEALPQLIDTIIKFLIDNVKTIAEAGITMFKALLEAVPVIVEAVVPLIPDIIDAITHALIDNAPLLFDATLEVFEELGRAILTFADKLPDYIFRLLEPVYDNFITPLKNGMMEIWDYLSKLPFIDFIVDVFNECVETVKTAIGKVKGFFSGLWTSIKETFNGIGNFFSGIWDSIVETFKTIGTKVGDAIGKTFKTAINAVLETVENAINAVPDAINGAIDLLNEIPGVDIGSMDRISLPRLAKGGIVDRGTLAMVGENGREAILPLENNKAALKEIAELLADEITRSTAAAQGVANNQPVTNNYNFTQTNNSPKALSRWDIYRQTNNQIREFEMRGVLPKNV